MDFGEIRYTEHWDYDMMSQTLISHQIDIRGRKGNFVLKKRNMLGWVLTYMEQFLLNQV